VEQKLKKVLLLSSGDTFGAYEWIYRMAKALITSNYEVRLLVREKRKTEDFIIKVPIELRRKSYPKRLLNLAKRLLGFAKKSFLPEPKYVFLTGEDESISIASADVILSKISFKPDIVISGMTDGFLGTTTLSKIREKTGARIFQAMFDMSLLTGGCHFVWNCEGFKSDCSNCPAIKDDSYAKFSENNLAIKKKNIKENKFVLLVVQGWTFAQANNSAIYKDREKIIVGICIDIKLFNNVNRSIAKQIFNIPNNAKVIFAGANNAGSEVKGRKLFVEALSKLHYFINEIIEKDVVILMAGYHNNEDEYTKTIPYKKVVLDYITDYRLLSLVYQASDVFVCPSLEDGGPMMVAEALACGTPVVGFEMGLLFDDSIIKNGYNGYRVKMRETNEMAERIATVISLSEMDFKVVSNNARGTAINSLSEQFFLSSVINLDDNRY
jgi:glycosyltransferase involved in cell wall biosynthesis